LWVEEVGFCSSCILSQLLIVYITPIQRMRQSRTIINKFEIVLDEVVMVVIDFVIKVQYRHLSATKKRKE